MISLRMGIAQTLLVVIGWNVAACSSNDAANASRKSNSSEDSEEYEDEETSSSSKSSSKKKKNSKSTPTTAVTQDAAAGSDFEAWCAKAAETKAIKNKLGANFSLFCDGGTPTELLTTTLLTAPYSGQGEPKMIDIKPLGSSGSTSSYQFAVGIRIPISLKTHFEKIGPNGGDVNQIKKVAEAGGGTATITMKQEFADDGKYQKRGWLFNQLVKRKVAIVTIATEIDIRTDQHELTSGKHYLYTQYIDKSIQVMTALDLVTAGIEMGDAHMLLTVINVETGNKGFPEIAEKEIKTTAVNIVKQMYELAANYDGEEVPADGGKSE